MYISFTSDASSPRCFSETSSPQPIPRLTSFQPCPIKLHQASPRCISSAYPFFFSSSALPPLWGSRPMSSTSRLSLPTPSSFSTPTISTPLPASSPATSPSKPLVLAYRPPRARSNSLRKPSNSSRKVSCSKTPSPLSASPSWAPRTKTTNSPAPK